MKITGFFRNGLAKAALLPALVLLFLGSTFTYGIGAADDDMQVLERGPIHEAFAEVSVDEVQPESVVPRSVPDPVNEIVPDYRPAGADMQWIPGYWSWDEDLDDFIWISGVWRNIPPGRQWVPGYWVAVAGGSQYVSGYWAENRGTVSSYLPPPPEPPPTAPPPPPYTTDNVWVEGHWLWSGSRYMWQAGYWQHQMPEMLWIPAHYSWTPRGYIFVPGYWDYLLVRRGVLYAPRYFPQPGYRVSPYRYTPSIMLDLDVVFLSLFVRRDHHHYYFGDYHDARYIRRGFAPWYSRHATRHGYDPHFVSYRRHHFHEDDRWEDTYRQRFEYHRDHRETRPPLVHRDRREQYHAVGFGEDLRNRDRNRREIDSRSPARGGDSRIRPDRNRDDRQHQLEAKNDRPSRFHTVAPATGNNGAARQGRLLQESRVRREENRNEVVVPHITGTPRQGERLQEARIMHNPRREIRPSGVEPVGWHKPAESDRARLERPAKDKRQHDDGQSLASFRERKPPVNRQQRQEVGEIGRSGDSRRKVPPLQRPQRQARPEQSAVSRIPPDSSPGEMVEQSTQAPQDRERNRQDTQGRIESRPQWKKQQERGESKRKEQIEARPDLLLPISSSGRLGDGNIFSR